MKRKVLSIILAAALTGTMLAGCGSSAKQETPAVASATGAPVSEQPAESSATQTGTSGKQTDGKNVPELTSEPLTITLWDISTEDPGKTTMEEAVQRFMADYPNITINQVHQQNDNYKQQLVVAMSSKQAPDMYIHWGGG
ncbi:MAG: extracellular solute-binding protein, partial [Eisenbergiella massiliensis]|uniref:extracellular solute-binding protein n=3 Tax=Eisenbergiella TaxID=1432051 RepID=UPI0023F12F3E